MQDLKKLEHAYKICAKIVNDFGDSYLPLFERLYNDLQKAKKLSDLKRIAMATCNEKRI